MSIELKDLQKVAKEFNDTFGLNPEIEMNQSIDALKLQIKEGSELIDETDKFSLAAEKTLHELGYWKMLSSDEKYEKPVKKVTKKAVKKSPLKIVEKEAEKEIEKAEPVIVKNIEDIEKVEDKIAQKGIKAKGPNKNPTKKKEKVLKTRKQLFLEEVQKAGEKGISMSEIKKCDWNTESLQYYGYVKFYKESGLIFVKDGKSFIKK
jgi:flagellar biosynthesis GTPase FlhF